MITRTKLQQENRDKRLQRLLFKETKLLKKLNKVALQIKQIDKKMEMVKVAEIKSKVDTRIIQERPSDAI